MIVSCKSISEFILGTIKKLQFLHFFQVPESESKGIRWWKQRLLVIVFAFSQLSKKRSQSKIQIFLAEC